VGAVKSRKISVSFRNCTPFFISIKASGVRGAGGVVSGVQTP
jgi:hypothetical protein